MEVLLHKANSTHSLEKKNTSRTVYISKSGKKKSLMWLTEKMKADDNLGFRNILCDPQWQHFIDNFAIYD